MGVTDVFFRVKLLKYIKHKLSSILKRHCYHSNYGYATFGYSFWFSKSCFMQGIEFDSSNKLTLCKILGLKPLFSNLSETVYGE
jgi:hypothetical protein